MKKQWLHGFFTGSAFERIVLRLSNHVLRAQVIGPIEQDRRSTIVVDAIIDPCDLRDALAKVQPEQDREYVEAEILLRVHVRKGT